MKVWPDLESERFMDHSFLKLRLLCNPAEVIESQVLKTLDLSLERSQEDDKAHLHILAFLAAQKLLDKGSLLSKRQPDLKIPANRCLIYRVIILLESVAEKNVSSFQIYLLLARLYLLIGKVAR